jgi:hypothetical protein
MEHDVRTALGEYARSLADWRRARYQDDLRDRRNLRSADGLIELAEFLPTVPADDPRLARLTALCLQGHVFEPGQQLAYELGRFRFYSDDATLDGLLDQLVELAEADAGERGRFGGTQVPGDEPWR